MTKRNTNAPQGHHGTDIFEDRGLKYGTKVQETRMSTSQSGHKYDGRRSDIWDAIIHTDEERAKEVPGEQLSY